MALTSLRPRPVSFHQAQPEFVELALIDLAGTGADIARQSARAFFFVTATHAVIEGPRPAAPRTRRLDETFEILDIVGRDQPGHVLALINALHGDLLDRLRCVLLDHRPLPGLVLARTARMEQHHMASHERRAEAH